jgi:hypothetical protein
LYRNTAASAQRVLPSLVAAKNVTDVTYGRKWPSSELRMKIRYSALYTSQNAEHPT